MSTLRRASATATDLACRAAGQCQVVCGPSVSTDLINVPKRLPCPAVWLLIFAQGVGTILKEWNWSLGQTGSNIATGAARSVARDW